MEKTFKYGFEIREFDGTYAPFKDGKQCETYLGKRIAYKSPKAAENYIVKQVAIYDADYSLGKEYGICVESRKIFYCSAANAPGLAPCTRR